MPLVKHDLIGKRFGKLTVTKQISNKIFCRCDCGNEVFRNKIDVTRKRSKNQSCGCFPRYKDLVGKTFHFLKVISWSHKKGDKNCWNCLCSCGKIKAIDGFSLTRGNTKSCGCLRRRKRSIPELKKKLLSRIEKTDSGCWNWLGSIKPCGYGNWGSFPAQTAHRASFFIYNGELPKGKYICHHCDNKLCVNPDHLYAGTPKDNTRDALERGQYPRGPNKKKGKPREKNNKAKLTEEKVKYIRFLCENGFKRIEMAKFFGVHVSTILKIASRRTWA